MNVNKEKDGERYESKQIDMFRETSQRETFKLIKVHENPTQQMLVMDVDLYCVDLTDGL